MNSPQAVLDPADILIRRQADAAAAIGVSIYTVAAIKRASQGQPDSPFIGGGYTSARLLTRWLETHPQFELPRSRGSSGEDFSDPAASGLAESQRPQRSMNVSAGASIYSRKGSPYFYVSYFSVDRLKRVHEATPWRTDTASGRRNAERYLAEKIRLAQLLVGSHGDGWAAWVRLFLQERYGRSPTTFQRYENAWKNISTYLLQEKVTRPAHFTYSHVAGYMTWRTAQRRHRGTLISRNTARQEIKLMSVIMAEAVRREFTFANPCARLPFPKEEPAEKPEITPAQERLIRQLLAEKEGQLPITERWMTVSFEIAIHQGCRLTETQIPLERIDIAGRRVQFYGKGRNGSKKVFTTLLHDGLVPLMQELRTAGATQTCTLPRMAAKDWHFFFKGRPELANLCFHCTRVTVITRLARAGVPISKAMRFVGHASQSVHRIYQRLTAEDLGECVSALGGSNSPSDGPNLAALDH
ncbi:MAG TPA: site-specific integrase [Opitutaceae bacterium]|jgi:site-specific recombinase XerD|nr:site-specific integrase [Opitutaceae bacterium]